MQKLSEGAKAAIEKNLEEDVKKIFTKEEVDSRRKANDCDRFDSKNDGAQKFIYNTTQHVSLSELYEIVGICNTNPSNDWCPVLLKLGH